MTDSCESCGQRQVDKLIYFNDGGATFAVCRSCAHAAEGSGCSIMELDSQYALWCEQ